MLALTAKKIPHYLNNVYFSLIKNVQIFKDIPSKITIWS